MVIFLKYYLKLITYNFGTNFALILVKYVRNSTLQLAILVSFL